MNQSNLKIEAVRSAMAAILAVTVTTGLSSTAVNASNRVDTEHAALAQYYDVHITDVGLLLFNDRDRDGYFTRFSLTIDAETRYREERVYAAIDLVDSAFNTEPLHVTNTFSLYRHTLSDNYQLDLDLLRDYPTDRYSLQVSLHSANDNRLLDQVSAAELRNLGNVPLESEDLDRLSNNDGPIDSESDFTNPDVRVDEYAGSASLLLIIGGFLALAVRRLTRGRDRSTTWHDNGE